MKKLDQFILKTFIGPFIAILFVVVFILMMQFLWLYIDELVGKGLGFRVIIEFMGWGCATLLPLALPLATLLSSMMTMGNLGENNELLAIKAAGISLQRIMFPLTLVSVLIAIGTFFATNNLVPIAYNEIYTLRDDIGRTKDEIKIPGTDRKLYLSAILDLYDRSPVSYVVSSRNNNKLVFDTFEKAIQENPDARPLFHSDRGFQYTSKMFQYKLKEQGMEQSMSRVGHCIDNGPTEGFWGIIKTEMNAMYKITDETSLRNSIDEYMHFYAYERPQERFGCRTPAEVRKEAMESKNVKVYPIAENKRIQKYKEKWSA